MQWTIYGMLPTIKDLISQLPAYFWLFSKDFPAKLHKTSFENRNQLSFLL